MSGGSTYRGKGRGVGLRWCACVASVEPSAGCICRCTLLKLNGKHRRSRCTELLESCNAKPGGVWVDGGGGSGWWGWPGSQLLNVVGP